VRFEVDEVELGQVCLRVIRFLQASVTSPKFHTLHLHVALARSKNGRSVGTFKRGSVLSQIV
jgi:hypothetical protein